MSALRDALRELPEAVFADLLESDDAYVLVVDLPGATSETTEVLAEDGRLTIEARREKATPEGFRYIREERPLFLDADLPLPSDANGEEADADMDRGVIQITLPKRDESGKPIPIEEAGDKGADERPDSDSDSDPDPDSDSDPDPDSNRDSNSNPNPDNS